MNIKNLFNSLNGWQRIFVVLIIVVYLPIVTIATIEDPKQAPPLDDIKVATKGLVKELGLNDKTFYGDCSFSCKDVPVALEDGTPIVSSVQFDSGAGKTYAIFFTVPADEKTLDKFGNLISSEVSSYALKQRLWFGLEAALIGAGIMGGLYLLGFLLGWIVRGFKKG